MSKEYLNDSGKMYNRIKEKYVALQQSFDKGEILFRFESQGALILDRRKTTPNRGMEYYVSNAVASLIKILTSGISFDVLYRTLKSKGYNDDEILLRLEKILAILDFKVDSMKDLKVVKMMRGHPSDSRAPHMAAFELTERCNLQCIYCYSESSPYKRSKEMSTSEVFKTLEKLKDAGVLQIWVGGGEPLLRTDIVPILQKMRELNFYIYLSTNGVMLANNYNLAKKISCLADEVHISLDGATPETHNRLRGGYDEIIKALKIMGELSQQGGAKLTLGSVISRLNKDEIEDIIDIGVEVGASAWVWSPLYPVGRGAKAFGEVLKKEDLITLHYKLKDIASRIKKIQILTYVPGVTPLYMGERTKRCGAVNYYINVRPNGDVYPCTYLRDSKFKLGNILHSDIDTILNTPLARFLKTDIDRLPPIDACDSCPLYLKGYCNTGCKAIKYEIYGSLMGRYPFCTYGLPNSPLNTLHKL